MRISNQSNCRDSVRRALSRSNFNRALLVENLEQRRLLAVDVDDSIFEAVSLGQVSNTPVVRSGSVSPDVDVDMFRISVNAGQVVDIDIDTGANGAGGLGSYLRLFNASGQEIAVNNDANAPGEDVIGFDAYLRYRFATAGNYYIGVSNANNVVYDSLTGDGDIAGGFYSIGDYQLSVQAIPLDPDDEVGEATALGFVDESPSIVNGSISTDIDVDMYSFSVERGQVVDFDIDTVTNGQGGLGSYLRLFNAQGEQLAFNDDANAPGEDTIGFDAYLRYRFENPGTYYIGVSNFNNGTYDPRSGDGDTAGGFFSVGDYRLTVQSLPLDLDDEFTEANSLGGVGQAPIRTSASISPDTDVDLYRFTVSAGQTVDFDIDTVQNGPGGLGSFLRLFNSSGELLATNDDAAAPGENVIGFDAYLRYRFDAPGTYYIGVSNFTNVTYDPQTGNGDTAGGSFSIGDYQLIVQAAVENPIDNDDSIAEATSLGRITSAANSVSGTIDPGVDVDFYSFRVVAGQVVDFDVDTPNNSNAGLGSYLRLFDVAGSQLAFNDNARAPGENALTSDAYLRYTFQNAGTYYIAVSNESNTQYDPVSGDNDVFDGPNATGTYLLSVQSLTADLDDSLSEATPLGSIQTAPISSSAAINPDIDVDLYSFQVQAGQTVDFDIDTTLNGSGGLGSYLRLFDASGVQLAVNDDANAPGENSIGFDAYLRYRFQTTGTYYIGVSNFNNINYDPLTGNVDAAGGTDAIGSYRLIIKALPNDADDSISEAVTLGQVGLAPISRNSAIETDIDVDMYEFAVAAGQVVDIDVDTVANGPGGLGSYLRLFDSSGQELAFNDDAVAPGESGNGFDAYLRYIFPTAGTYYVAVSNANNTGYDPLSGGGDVAGGFDSIGEYAITLTAMTESFPELAFSVDASSIDEAGGRTVGTVRRINADLDEALTVSIVSSDANTISVPTSVVIPVNEQSVNFEIVAVDDPLRGTRQASVTVSSTGFESVTQTISVVDVDLPWQNPSNPTDTNNDGSVTPLDALLIINYLNSAGSGPVPTGDPFPFYDVNGDNFVSPVDVLLVINELNNRRASSGEGEASDPFLLGIDAAMYYDVDALTESREDEAQWAQAADQLLTSEF